MLIEKIRLEALAEIITRSRSSVRFSQAGAWERG